MYRYNPLLKIGFDITGGTEVNYTEVANFSALPSAASHTNETYYVQSSQGTWILGTRKDSGLYRSDGVNWIDVDDIPYYFTSSEFAIKDSTDSTKKVQLLVNGVATGTTRTLTVPNKNITLAGIDNESFTGLTTITNNFSASSGSVASNTLLINSVIAQSGSATGTVRSIYINPTGTVLGTHYAIEATSGLLNISPNGTGMHVIGTAKIGSFAGDGRAYFMNNALTSNTTNFAFLQWTDGNVMFNAPAGSVVYFGNNGGIQAILSTNGLAMSNLLSITASNTSRSGLRFTSGVAPTTPTNGDVWFDGSDLYLRAGGVTYKFTKT